MMTLLGSLLGFAASAFPEILKLQREKEDRKHQLAMFDRQVELQKLGHTQKLDELNINADIKETEQVYNYANRDSGVHWVEGLQSSVRPVITYAFFLVFAVVKIAALRSLAADGLELAEALQAIWDTETQALFAAVMGFWFGSRQIQKLRGG